MIDLFVSAGQDLTAKLWNAFWAERRRRRLVAGPGVLVRDSGDGQVISFRNASGAFLPSFKPTVTGSNVTFRLGLVNGLEPLIGGVPITGEPGRSAPRLALRDTEEMFDATGRSWLALRVKIDPATGQMLQPDENGDGELELTIEQRRTCPATDPDDDTIGYHRIAVLRRPASSRTGLGTVRAIAMFDYQHRTSRDERGWRHFFDPA